MLTRSYGITDRGKVRDSNEDALFIDEAHQVFAVADGLGGLPGGARASSRITELLEKTFSQVDLVQEQVDLRELVLTIHKIVRDESREQFPYTGSGSTLTLAQIIDDHLIIAHVGDSAVYHWRSGTINKITTDHTMAQELIKRLGEGAHDSMPPEYPHTLTRCIGQDGELQVDLIRIQVAPDDRILVCSDGLNKVMNDEQICEILGHGSDPQQICDLLLKATYAKHAPDNVTVIVTFMV